MSPEPTVENGGSHRLALGVDTAQPLSEFLIGELDGLCDRIEDAGGSAVAVIRLGDATAVTPGTGWPGEVGIHLVNKWERALRRLERVGAVTVAVAAGAAGGPALEVLLACDYRIGGSAMRLSLPGRDGEPWPGMLVHRLANQLGPTRARHLVLFGGEISATQALQLGVLDDVVDDTDSAVAAKAASLTHLTGTELAVRRRLLLDATTTSFEEALGAHLAACDRALRRARPTGPTAPADPTAP
ncbi:hypothetical protein BLA24_02470 [Streptomyces cinnamoneus]|uniref:Uncharacterized protein n=1 Tax=Streptomyces cinnamoneus TaxID=53446 RepID=A0A2G1XQ13_STRCJ|nr:enoyl-CoA-hydratase DpgB [Streptomyces cinnamoneus]PHQ53337.1 hypothetical protein BLA24_02470 [Streptomyces cinnamoneus]PPT16355.1 enoyl-CoA hydratase [Streptomyces cinnamoneus]